MLDPQQLEAAPPTRAVTVETCAGSLLEHGHDAAMSPAARVERREASLDGLTDGVRQRRPPTD